MLHSISIEGKHEVSIVVEFIDDVFAQEGPSVSFVVDGKWCIPVEKCNPGSNSCRYELIKNVIVKCNSLSIYSLVSSSVRKNSSP
jgi:hypothetical protein